MSSGPAEEIRPARARQVTGEGRERDDRGERNAYHDQAERQRGQGERRRCADDATAHSEHCGGDERYDGGPESAHDAGDGGDLTELHIDRAHGAKQDE